MSNHNVRFAHIFDIGMEPVRGTVINVDHIAYIVKNEELKKYEIFLVSGISFDVFIEDQESIFNLKEVGVHLY